MGDSADTFRALKQYHKEQRQQTAVINIDKLVELGIAAHEQSKNVFRIDTHCGAVMYYPSGNKWQHRGRVHRGSVTDLQQWLKRNGLGK